MDRADAGQTVEPNTLEDQTLRRKRVQGKRNFPCLADHKQDWQPYPVDAQSAESDEHTHSLRFRFRLGPIYILNTATRT